MEPRGLSVDRGEELVERGPRLRPVEEVDGLAIGERRDVYGGSARSSGTGGCAGASVHGQVRPGYLAAAITLSVVPMLVLAVLTGLNVRNVALHMHADVGWSRWY